MVEVTFSDGAAASLTEAARRGLLRGDAGEHEVFCLPLYLDVGQLEDDVLGPGRRRVIERIFEALPFRTDVANSLAQSATEALREIPRRLKGREPLRIWRSDSACEMCCSIFFMSWLSQLPARGRVTLCHLPPWIEREDGTVVMHTSCAELEPDDFARLAPFEREVPALLLAGMHFDWGQLKAQNAELRAVVSGHVMSVPASFYDFLLYGCLADMPEVFPEALLIGNVLGSTQIRMSDGWLALRIAGMVERGELGVVEENQDKDAPAYHRTLRKLMVR